MQNLPSYADFWKTFDMILIINLKEDKHRRVQIKAMCNKLSIPCQFFDVERHPEGGFVGSFESHQLCMRKAYATGCQNVLIFEDDAEILNMPSQKAMDEVSRFIKTHQDWEIFYLGSNPLLFNETTQKLVGYSHVRGIRSTHAHAYVASRKYMEKFMQVNYALLEQPVDVYASFSKRAFAVFPTWFYQPKITNYSPTFFHRGVINAKNWYAFNVNIQLEYVVWVMSALFMLLIILLIYMSLSNLRK